MARPPLLNDILETARKRKSQTDPLQAIFDLDSTLFDVSPRITKIFHSFSALPEMKTAYPKETSFLAKLTPHPGDYGVKKTLERSGFSIHDTSPEFVKVLVAYWKKCFFSDDFLHHDVPYPGAVRYVNDLKEAGAEIFYLTGRDIPRMLQGSIASLKQHGFPLSSDNSNLLLKPSSETKDSVFKQEFFGKLDVSGDIWFFENEPTNIHLIQKTSPHVKIVFVETVHSGSAPLPAGDIYKISGFGT